MATIPSIHLRPVVPNDIPALYQFQLDPESNDLAGVNPRDLDTFNAVWDKIFNDPETKAVTVPRAIVIDDGKGGETLVGCINVFRREGLDFVGYWIDRVGGHWGKGYAGRALTLLLEEVPIRPLHARAARSNVASIRVLTRNGFVITGYRHSPATERFHACEEALLVLA